MPHATNANRSANMDHTHTWKRSKKIHKGKGRFFVECKDCGVTFQATISYGHLHVFKTGAIRGEKPTIKSYRLKPWQKNILNTRGISFVEFVDQAFQKENIPVS